MGRALRFILVLVAGLALLTWAASLVVQQTTRGWFDRDIQLRSKLAVAGAHDALVSHWGPDQQAELRDALSAIGRDERIMAVIACGSDLALLAQSGDCPDQISCGVLGPRVRPSTDAAATDWALWASEIAVPGGNVHATAIPVVDGGRAIGFVVLVHDMSFVGRREATARRFLLIAFAFLAIAAPIVTIIAARMSWRSWGDELRRLIKGAPPRAEFLPFVRDVRDLVDRLASERETDGLGGLWTAQRLKNTLSRHLHGERVVIVANREPYIHEYDARGRDPRRSSGERSRDRARTGDAGLLGGLGGPRQRLGGPRVRRPARARACSAR